jgi:glycosyltransferase involved in cell wall biosynthesis
VIRDVAYVVNMFPKLSETFIAQEVAELVRRGVRCRLLSLKPPSEALRHPVVTRLGLERLTWYDREAFAAALMADPPEVVHAHFATEPARVGREIASTLGRPFSFTAHGYDLYRKPPADLADRVAGADAVVTVSDANAAHLAATCGVVRDRVLVLPCGVDLDFFTPGPDVDPATIVAVARLRPVKNLPALLDACRRLADRGRTFRLVVIGDGPDKAALTARRDALGLSDRVTFAGACDQDTVRTWWRRATVGVLSSHSEGMPVSLMEAAACGVPAVAPAVGGIPELIDDGVTGCVTPPGDTAALADALDRVLADPARRRRMGRAARARAEQRFGSVRQVDALVDCWTRMTAGAAA